MSDPNRHVFGEGVGAEPNPPHESTVQWHQARNDIEARRKVALVELAKRHLAERNELNARFDEELRAANPFR